MSELTSQLSRCISQYFEPSRPGATFREVLNLVADPERYPRDLAAPVGRNQALSHLVFRTDFLQTRLQEWISETPDGKYDPNLLLERTFTLLGRKASRNLIACVQVQRILGILPRKKNDRFALSPNDQIKFSTAAESYAEDRGFAFVEWAFVGGLHFDLLQACLQKNKGPRDVLSNLPTSFSESVKEARLAYEIGSVMGAFKGSELLFASALALGTGKILMNILFPKDLLSKSYTAFFAEGEKLKAGKWEHLEVRERDRFEITAAEMAGLYVSWLGLMGDVEKAITYSVTPIYLKKSHPEFYKLACILHLANALSSGRPFTVSHQASFKDLGLKQAQLDAIKKKVSSAP